MYNDAIDAAVVFVVIYSSPHVIVFVDIHPSPAMSVALSNFHCVRPLTGFSPIVPFMILRVIACAVNARQAFSERG